MLALQGRIQEGPVGHLVMLWAVEHAGELLAKRSVGRGGRTPCTSSGSRAGVMATSSGSWRATMCGRRARAVA
eukprot:13558024-Alexandrium_andersonii.AAC.1